MKNSFLIWRIVSILLIVTATALVATGQQANMTAPPIIAAAGVPLYPQLARMARIEGVVHVKVTTDGHRSITAKAEDGHKMLAAAAEQNAQTWEFETHEPTTFIVTYQYKLVEGLKDNPSGPTVILRFPTEVEVLATPIVINDPAPEVTR